MELVVAVAMYLIGLAGMWYHWLEVQERGHAAVTFFQYMTTSQKDTGKALTAFTAVMVGLYTAGSFDMVRMDAFIEAAKNGVVYSPMMSAVVLAFTAGYACDSKLNK